MSFAVGRGNMSLRLKYYIIWAVVLLDKFKFHVLQLSISCQKFVTFWSFLLQVPIIFVKLYGTTKTKENMTGGHLEK